MIKTHKNVIQQSLALLLCLVIIFGIVPFPAFANATLLTLPDSVSLTDMAGDAFGPNQELTPGGSFYVIYNYETVSGIDSSRKYELPQLSDYIEVIHEFTGENLVSMPISDAVGNPLGTLELNTLNGNMTFQFVETLNGGSLSGFFLKFAVKLDEDAGNIGQDIVLSFPIDGGTMTFHVTIVDTKKDPPTIAKSGAKSVEVSETGDVEILWTITVTHADNPQKDITLKDSWSNNQEYVDGSFCKNDVSVDEGLGLSINNVNNSLEYMCSDIIPRTVEVYTYKTRIKSSAFLNKNGVPLTNQNIKCTNTVKVAYPAGSTTELPKDATASYSHPITWLYKTSGDVLNRETGEMEWTITIYNNGLNMQNVVLYDRLSPGVVIKENTATMQIGNGTEQTLHNFKRIEGDDLTYNSDSSRTYNLSYPLGNIGNVAVIKYRTIIDDMETYDAGAHLPPDSIFDNKAFIAYQLPSGGGLSSVISSPVVEKSGGFDSGLLGKEGLLETAYHTIKWTVTVNDNDESLTGVKVTDKLTPADPVSAVPRSKRLCKHIYDNALDRNKPLYSYGEIKDKPFTPYDESYPTTPFTYRLVPTGTEVYDIVFYLGDISEKVTIVFRSTATDEIIFANNVTGTNCHYENRATLVTTGNAFSYASADVVYTSNVYQKSDARSWHNKTEHSYNFQDNTLPWLMRVNINQMEMTNIVITDTLNEGTSLVEGSIIVGSGTDYWYNLMNPGTDTIHIPRIPEYTEDAEKPFYTYDEATRVIQIFLNDITGSVVGTSEATKQVVFYAKIDVDHPIFNDPTRKVYIQNNNGLWSIPNTGSMENNYLSKENAVIDGAAFNVNVQHMNKSGVAYKNGQSYSIDYSLGINRIQQTLPEPTVVKDTIPVGLRLDASTVHLYEATAISPDMFHVKDNGTNGKIVKGDELDSSLYTLDMTVNDDGTSIMRLTLPENSGKKMYIVEYSCDVTDVSKAPFTNSASIEGVQSSSADQTTTKLVLTSASGGGTLMGVNKTTVIVRKIDAASENPVKGAEFGIYYNGLLIEKRTTDENGLITFNNLNENYTYTIKELDSAPGYLEPIDIEETVKATNAKSPVILTFTNALIWGTAQFMKTDEVGAALPNAKFGIWENAADVGEISPTATAFSGQNGMVTFTSLAAGNSYYIAEINAPENYQKSEEVIVVKMGINGAMEKLWLQSDETQTPINTFKNSRVSLASLVVSKDVIGNMGDRTKAFAFTLNIDANANLPAGSALQGVKTAADGTETAVQISVGTPYEFTLADEEYLTVDGLQPGTQYTVAEDDDSAIGYTSSFVTTRYGISGAITSGRSAAGTIAPGTNIEAFTNTSNMAVPTGVALDVLPYVLIILIATIGSTLLLQKRKKRLHTWS